MNNPLFSGVCTALVTPFQNGKPDLPCFRQLIHRQLAAGIRALVICGTTGEAPTLTEEEKLMLFAEAKKDTEGHALIIAGTGSNCTGKAAELSRKAEQTGADALLVVTPYYNKATAQGLIEHYRTIAQAVSLPVVLYNVPSRTGVDIPISVCQELAALPNIAGIKEASPDLRKAAHMRKACPDDFAIWSGNDDLLLPMLSLGASGVISVASNVAPAQMQKICLDAEAGNWELARSEFLNLLALMDALFSEVNPIPVKAAMALLGLPCGSCRLPLTDASPETCSRLRALLSEDLQ